MRVNTSVAGGNRLASRLDQLRRRLQDNSAVYVGVPAQSGAYEDGAGVATIAAVQEFGSADGHIPERSFLRVPLRSNQELFASIIKNQAPLVIRGEITMRQMMDQLGARGAAVSQEAISEGISPDNAESTKARKGSSTPLVGKDGYLRPSITHVVSEDE